jgi:ferrous iron transport protein B
MTEKMHKSLTIALSGNPNAGKTTLFNALTGARQHIANYPGVTVEKKTGKAFHAGHEITVVDLPGTYSLTAYSLEEIVARNFLIDERPDLVVDIVDASNLDRNLYLALQFKELGIPLIIALNMIDMAENRGIVIDYGLLSSLIGVPVVPIIARASVGLDELMDKILEVNSQGKSWQPELISYGMDIDQGVNKIAGLISAAPYFKEKYPPEWLALKCIEGDPEIRGLLFADSRLKDKIAPICDQTYKHIHGTLEDEPEGVIAEHRYGYIAGVIKQAVKRKIESRIDLSDKADMIITNRVLGPIIMLAILYGIYEFTFKISKIPIGWLESLFDLLKRPVIFLIPQGKLQSLIISGIIDGVGGILSFIPLIMLMFLAIAIMEDSGYMARIAYMLDRVLRWFGLHGNSVMSFIVSGGISGGCAVPGVLATRTLRDPKERIATLLVVPFMNCGAKLPVFAMIIAAFFPANQAGMMFIFTLLSWSFALFSAKLIRSTVLRGPKTPFVMELPPYRAPTIKGMVIHTWERTWQYIRKAGSVILVVSIILWACMTYPGLNAGRQHYFEAQREGLASEMLAAPENEKFIKNSGDLNELDNRVSALQKKDNRAAMETSGPVKSDLVLIAEAAVKLKGSAVLDNRDIDDYSRCARNYLDYKERLLKLEREKQTETLKRTAAGRLGNALEFFTSKIGFDYRTNVALIGGFAAKEVIVSTLGTAYSLGDEGSEAGSLSEKLRQDPVWSPLAAFTFVLFMMLYVPCLITIVSIARESSWSWAAFSVCFNLFAAYTISFIVYQTGYALGIGV